MKPNPPTTRSSAPARERGTAAAGAIVFSAVLVFIAVAGYLWLQGRNLRLEARQNGTQPTTAGAADKWTQRLGKFLRSGPTGGTWVTKVRSCEVTSYIALHPKRPEYYVIAQIDKDGVRKPLAVSRWLIPRHFFRSPTHLFFSNYLRTEGPIREELEDGTRTWRVHWAPRYHHDGLTERLVWFTEVGGEVVQIEDRSRSGRMIRRMTRRSKDTGVWNVADVDLETLEHLSGERPDRTADPEQDLAHARKQAPFDVYRPYYLPPGFVLVRATYTVADAALTPGEKRPDGSAPAPETPVQLVSQLYSDGLALISVGVAPKEDMNVIESMTAGMTDADDPAACPGVPRDVADLRQNGSVIRMRTDTCRIVLRRDDLEQVSVTVIGRNELPVDEYLRLIGSLKPVERP